MRVGTAAALIVLAGCSVASYRYFTNQPNAIESGLFVIIVMLLFGIFMVGVFELLQRVMAPTTDTDSFSED